MNRKAATVDVIIPVHNGARFVTEAIASVTTQDFAAGVTVWCIDDASDDELAINPRARSAKLRIAERRGAED